MAEYEVIQQDRLREVAYWLTAWEWPLTEADSIVRAANFGWTVVDEDPGNGELFDTGLLTTRSWASSTVSADGEVFELSVFTSPVVDGTSPSDRAFVTDTFAAQVDVVTEVLGQTSAGGDDLGRSASWQLASGAVLRVGRTDGNVEWTVDSPAYALLKRDVRAFGAEGEDEV